MAKDPTAFRERFKAYKDGKKPYKDGKTVIGSNVDMKDDGTFTDDYTRAFDDLIVTPQGPRVKPGQLYKYQEPWDDEKFMNAVTVGGLNNLSPSQWARRILDLQNGNLTVDSWLNGNNGIVPDDYAKEHPGMAAAANTLFDFWTLGGTSMVKNAKNWAQLARSIGKQTPKQTFTFDFPEQQVAEEQKHIQQVKALEGTPATNIVDNQPTLLLEGNQPKLLEYTPELPPEASYTGKIPKQVVDLDKINQYKSAKQVIEDIKQDPTNYTMAEIAEATKEAAVVDNAKSTIPTLLPSSEKTIELGSNVQKQLKDIINPILDRYGYDPIQEGMDDIATREAVLDRAKQHRTFVRGVYIPPKHAPEYKGLTRQAAMEFNIPEDQVTDEQRLYVAATWVPKKPTSANDQGLDAALEYYGLNKKRYDGRYTSNRMEVGTGYSNPNNSMKGGKVGGVYKVSLPLRDNPNWSLPQIWEENEFPMLDVYDMSKSTRWRSVELPYLLKTGKQFPGVDVEKAYADEQGLKYLEDSMKSADEQIKGIPVPQKMKYSETEPSIYMWANYGNSGTINHPAAYRHSIPYTKADMEETITDITQTFHKYGIKPINPIREYTLEPKRFEQNGIEVMDPSYEEPQLNLTKVKYPVALADLKWRLFNIDHEFSKLSEPLDDKIYFAQNERDDHIFEFINWAKREGLITQKQYWAVRKTVKFKTGDPLKYLNAKQMVQAAKNKYFKDIRQARSKDAISRKNHIERQYDFDMQIYNNNVDRLNEWVSNIAKRVMFKDKSEIEREQQQVLKSSGVNLDNRKMSKDGYRIFTTEGIKEPDANDKYGTHFIMIGPRDTRILEFGGKIETESNRRHHGHGGHILPGISRNLGSGLIGIGAGSSTLKPRKKDEKK